MLLAGSLKKAKFLELILLSNNKLLREIYENGKYGRMENYSFEKILRNLKLLFYHIYKFFVFCTIIFPSQV